MSVIERLWRAAVGGFIYALAMGAVWLCMSIALTADETLSKLFWYAAASASGQLFVLGERI